MEKLFDEIIGKLDNLTVEIRDMRTVMGQKILTLEGQVNSLKRQITELENKHKQRERENNSTIQKLVETVEEQDKLLRRSNIIVIGLQVSQDINEDLNLFLLEKFGINEAAVDAFIISKEKNCIMRKSIV